MEVIDIGGINKIHYECIKEKVIDIINYINIKFIVIRIIRYKSHY